LPHWEKESGTYFITFRLADSLPQTALDTLRCSAASKLTKPEQLRAEFVILERYADAGHGDCLLRENQHAEIVANALRFKHGKSYRLIAWCVMPNHVHVCLKVLPGVSLARVVQGWKGYSAHTINQLLGRQGSLWMREYYDRLVRDEQELARTVQYILRNPEKAGLKNWPWVERVSES
jgi:REP element-mobilizing transposase RayT